MEPRRASASWVFKDMEYQLSSCVSSDWLEVTVEETVSSNIWKGKFEAKHIEELTRKTGNFKQFLVFTTMLESAINKSSESVTLDLLTYTDLESLRERRNAMAAAAAGGANSHQRTSRPQPPLPENPPGKRYLILTYSVEFDRIHYPLALSYAGKADSSQLRNTVCRLAAELEKYKRQGKKGSALARLQKDYDALLREKEELVEAVESLQTQLTLVQEGGGEGEKKQIKMLQEVIRNLEEEVLQERTKHQRYVSKKTEELRALTQELGELRSSERTLRSRVKNLTNELALLKKGMRSSPSGYLRPRNTPPTSSSSSIFKKTPSSTTAGSGGRHRHRQRGSSKDSLDRKRGTHFGSGERRRGTHFGSGERKRGTHFGSGERRRGTHFGSGERRRGTHFGSGERKRGRDGGSGERQRGRSGSYERRVALGVSNSRLRTPSPRGGGGGHWMRFDPSAYVENKRRQQKENQERFQRLRSPSYHGPGTHSRSSSLEKPLGLRHHSRSGSGGSLGRPPAGLRHGSRRLWGSSEGLRGARTRSSSLCSLSGHSTRGSSPVSSRGSLRGRQSLSDLEPTPPSSNHGRSGTSANRNNSKKLMGSSGRLRTSTPTSRGKSTTNRNTGGSRGSLLDHSTEMSEIDARLNALQQFMKRSLEANKSSTTRR